MSTPAPIELGFLTILEEESGFVGGFLVTNNWGRPLEFRLSSAVRPNRVQQILYAETLRCYLCADVIGKTLVEKTSIKPQLIVSDVETALELRHHVETPVLWLADSEISVQRLCAQKANDRQPAIFCHERFPDDVTLAQDRLRELDGILNLREPFVRVREAIGEARKMGVTNRR